MAVRNRKVRRPRRLNKHDTTLVRRRKKVRWLLAQRVRVRNYRRKFMLADNGKQPGPPDNNTAGENE
ncbi:hypothetical protein [Microbulbifer sp.]|uniref:hypothetical protein n=1 Tax=Microbulbifer sp. TaxID=1908541 RepID=UPI002584006A|nr:hypothetical protein [Microbulbifer sp.]